MYLEYECETCDRDFGSQQSANQHMDALNHWALRYECETCDREFYTQQSVNQHMDDTGHWAPQFECETCDRDFYTQRSANQHMDDTGHWKPKFGCEICDRRFHNQRSAEQHMDAVNHYTRRYCHDCSQGFQNENNMKMVSFHAPRGAYFVLSTHTHRLLTTVSTSTRVSIAARAYYAPSVTRP